MHWSKHAKFQRCKLSHYKGKGVILMNNLGQSKWDLGSLGDAYPNQRRNPWLSLSQLSQESQICQFFKNSLKLYFSRLNVANQFNFSFFKNNVLVKQNVFADNLGPVASLCVTSNVCVQDATVPLSLVLPSSRVQM